MSLNKLFLSQKSKKKSKKSEKYGSIQIVNRLFAAISRINSLYYQNRSKLRVKTQSTINV